ncbi:Uncharacterised protein [Legionella pneumophila]|nr:Uncharacterised protein [Legionella pneumophila]
MYSSTNGTVLIYACSDFAFSWRHSLNRSSLLFIINPNCQLALFQTINREIPAKSLLHYIHLILSKY